MNTKAEEKKPETKAIAPVDDFCNNLQKMQKQFGEALPPQIPVERFIRVAMTAIRTSTSLLEKCSKPSLFSAFIQAAQDGLLPDGREGAVVPFKGTAKWMPMVAGICKKARNSGEIKTLNSFVVGVNDHFDFWEDESGPHFKYTPTIGDRGADRCTLAYAVTKDGGVFTEIIDELEMAKIEASCHADNSPWKGPFRNEMKRKSAIRRLAKYRLPSNTDLDDLVRRDDDLYELEPTPAPARSNSSRLKEIIEIKADPVQEIPAAETPKPEIPQDDERTAIEVNEWKEALNGAESVAKANIVMNDIAKSKLKDEAKQILQLHYNQVLKGLKS